MKKSTLIALTALAMIAFAGNSLLCRLALKTTQIDAASFTSLRLISGALVLYLLVRLQRPSASPKGDWRSALMLFIYAAGFSFAYLQLPAALGALLLFGAVQTTMISYGIYRGERLLRLQLMGFALALGGLVVLLAPGGLRAPPLLSSLLMLTAGVAWGAYSIYGRRAGDATQVTAGNFLRCIPLCLALSLFTLQNAKLDMAGCAYALASGGLASGLGYAIWYKVLPALASTHAAALQLSVPVITALGGVMFLSEPISLGLALASTAILGGVAMVLIPKHTRKSFA